MSNIYIYREVVITATIIREIIDQWEIDTKRSSLRLLCFLGIPDRTRHRTSSRYYHHQPPALSSLCSPPYFEYNSIRREFSACHRDHATNQKRETNVSLMLLFPKQRESIPICLFRPCILPRKWEQCCKKRIRTFLVFLSIRLH